MSKPAGEYRLIVRLLTAGIAAILTACSGEATLDPFASDGCSLFPDRSQISADDWCNCCFEHDIAYWRGGTAEEREAADIQLRDCVQRATNNAALARVMYEGVRIGGSPYFHNWYRWGYGWNDGRRYQALTPAEDTEADRLLNDYFSDTPTAVCPV